MPNQKAHIDGAVKRIKEQIEVAIAGEFSAMNSSLESPISLFPSGPEKSFPESLD